MPESVTDRPTKSHEYLFLLSKQERYYFDADAVREEAEYDRRDWSGKHFKEGDIRINHMGTTTGGDSAAGRNIRTVWSIPTEAYPGAHFATFPRRLVEPCIKAGTSEKGCCPACGTGWVRVTEHKTLRDVCVGHILVNGKADYANAAKQRSGIPSISKSIKHQVPETKTTGWRPGCSCAPQDISLDQIGKWYPRPAVVLDPFIGSGTTIVVANALGRHGIGLDLSREYLRLAHRRINRPHAPVERPSKEESHPLFGEGA